MNIDQVREKFPQYDDLPDDVLLKGVHAKHYSDMPIEAFMSNFEPVRVNEATGKPLLQPTQTYDMDANKEKQSFTGGAVQSLLQGATLGFADEGEAGVAAATAYPFTPGASLSQLYGDARESFRGENQQFKKENPVTSTGLELLGGLATGGLAGGGKIAAAKTLPAAIKTGAAVGGATGAIAGAGYADAEDFFSEDTLIEAAKTGTLGALLGGVTPVAIKGALSAGKLVPKALPESLMETAVKVRPSVPQAQRASIIRTALDESIMPTTAGLEKVGKRLSALDMRLNTIIDDATEKGAMISKKALFTQLKQLRADLGGVNLRGGKNLKQIDDIAAAFDKQLKSVNKTRLTPREVQDLKRSAYRQLRFDVSQQSAQFAKTEAEKAVIRGARQSLEAVDPAVKGINRSEGKLLELGDELERAVSRLDNRNLISLDTAAKMAAGSATGSPVGTGAATAASVLGAPRVKARIAIILENLRKQGAIASEVNKTLSPEAAAVFSIMTENYKDELNNLIGD